MSKLLQELHACAAQQERELAALRSTVDRLRAERDERLDFCCDGEHGETTAVLPSPRFVPRGRIRDDETARPVRG